MHVQARRGHIDLPVPHPGTGGHRGRWGRWSNRHGWTRLVCPGRSPDLTAGITPEIGLELPMERAEEGFRAMLEGDTTGKIVFTR
jgi:hypothetical protein